jgi:hypothetical protein
MPGPRSKYAIRLTPEQEARFTTHTAFDDPTSPPDAAPRESIEIRTLVFFASENKDAKQVTVSA